MRQLFLTLGALSLVVPAATYAPSAAAQSSRSYHGKTVRKVCRRSSGTTGLIGGAVGGAVVGGALGGGVLGTVAGGVGGAFAGRAIDRSITAKKRCRYVEVRR
jgi:outer membrane lipoprotein SlyB